MGLIQKIEEIRKKPDHIKMRYVWLFVIICMFLVISIWFLSLKADLSESFLKKKKTSQERNEIQQSGSDFFQEIDKQKEALKNVQFETSPEQKNN